MLCLGVFYAIAFYNLEYIFRGDFTFHVMKVLIGRSCLGFWEEHRRVVSESALEVGTSFCEAVMLVKEEAEHVKNSQALRPHAPGRCRLQTSVSTIILF